MLIVTLKEDSMPQDLHEFYSGRSIF